MQNLNLNICGKKQNKITVALSLAVKLLDMPPKARMIHKSKKIINWTSLKSIFFFFFFTKCTVKKMKRQATDWEKPFANQTSE